MKLEIHKPSPRFTEYIQYYWYLEDSPEPSESMHRVIPTGLPELMISLGDRIICEADEPGVIQPRMTFCGQKNTFFDVRQTGKTRILSAIFTPLGASHLFHEPFSAILNSSVPVDDLFPADSDRLYEMLCHAATPAEMTKVLESFILDKMIYSYRKDYSFINRIVSAIRDSRGDITIDTICDRFDINSRFLERKFSDYIGMTPKNFLRIVRFQNVLDTYGRYNGSLTDLSMDCGYYDQSHFIREIREFTGYSPGELFSTCSIHSDFFAA